MENRNGSPEFYKLLEKAAEIHNKKSHDYASNENPFANYHFAGMMSKLFDNPDDAGFAGRLGEKLFRIANLENSNKNPNFESVEQEEIDIVTITVLWMASRRERKNKRKMLIGQIREKMDDAISTYSIAPHEMAGHQFLICGVNFTEICTRCNEGEDKHRLQHAIAVHSAAYDPKNHTLKYPNKPKLCLVGPKINLVD